MAKAQIYDCDTGSPGVLQGEVGLTDIVTPAAPWRPASGSDVWAELPPQHRALLAARLQADAVQAALQVGAWTPWVSNVHASSHG